MAKFWPSQNFPKKTTRVVSIPKIMKIYSGVWKILAKNTQKWLFWPFWRSKISDQKIFGWSSKSYGDTTSCKKSKKNIERSRLYDHNGRTYNVRMNESEFIGSFRSLKTSGEPIKAALFFSKTSDGDW